MDQTTCWQEGSSTFIMNEMGDPAITPRSIRQRLDELYRRLKRLPRADSAEEALRQLCQELEAVEDEMSGIAKQTPPPIPPASDGRMYCPLDDFIDRRDDGSSFAMTRGHRIEIGKNGSVRIVSKITEHVEFEK
jgi:hypothetical protein